MLGRRPGHHRYNRRGVGDSGGAPSFSALNFVDSSAVLQYIRADSAYVTRDGSGRVSQWNDIKAGLHYTQGTGANQPLYNATGGPNSRGIVSLDTVARYMSSSLALPIPSTTPTTMWFIARQVTWTNGRRILSDTTNLKRLVYQEAASPQIDIYDGGSVGNNAGGTVGSFARFHVFWNMGASRLHIGASNVTGLNPSAQAADVGRVLGNNAGSSAVVDFCEVLHMNRALTAGEESNLDTVYTPTYYGVGGVLV